MRNFYQPLFEDAGCETINELETLMTDMDIWSFYGDSIGPGNQPVHVSVSGIKMLWEEKVLKDTEGQLEKRRNFQKID